MNTPQSKLEEEKKRVQELLASLKLQDPFSDPERLNDNAASDTEANEEMTHERMEALEKELTIELSEIEEALDRIHKGTYGVCTQCGNQIAPARLLIKPTARYCAECAKKLG